mmetsp:Transcript_61907/g.182868  ORF Transcript_61907/g.182868 Transcript_61907/m.182868 type:complete len:114 (-) Transcript_61907:38-379(-)
MSVALIRMLTAFWCQAVQFNYILEAPDESESNRANSIGRARSFLFESVAKASLAQKERTHLMRSGLNILFWGQRLFHRNLDEFIISVLLLPHKTSDWRFALSSAGYSWKWDTH